MRKKLIILLILLISVFIVIKVSSQKKQEEKLNNIEQEIVVQELEDGTKLNTSKKLDETKKVGNLEISNSQLTNKDGKTTLLAQVKNVGNENIQMVELEVILLDKEGKEIKTLNGLLGTIKPGETTQLNVSSTSDYSQAYDYIIRIK